MACLRICLLIVVCLLQGTIQADSPGGEKILPVSKYHFTLPDHRGHEISLKETDSRLVVVAFLGTQCPLAKLYAGRLQQIAESYPKDQVSILAVDSNAQDSLAEIQAFVRDHKLSYPVLKDLEAKVADTFGAERTPEVFLLDADRAIRYRGRIDDQYVIGIQRTKPEREDLKTAIDELLAGKRVSIAHTSPLGCLIGRIKPATGDLSVTYSNQISRIFQKRCVECHRPNEIGPFSMLSYEEVAGWGPMIAEVVEERRMPPWHADPHVGKFVNDTSLTTEERELIATWVKNGCPEGNPSELPPPVNYVEGWQFPRDPDLVIAMGDKPFQVPAEGGKDGIRYQQFWAPTNLSEDKWLVGAEVRPGNRAVVHHVIVYAHPNGKGSKKHDFLTAYVPGLRITPGQPGSAKRLPANSWLRFEVHYTPNGVAQEDLTQVGFLFMNPQEVTHEVKTTVAGSQSFVIQPQLENQSFVARSQKSPVDVQLVSMSPHMHLRGKAFEYVAEYPGGKEEVLLKVPRYDFNWQTRYVLATPKTLPAGTTIRCTAVFDNSPKNLANPDPTATVVWGDQSWEEMLLGYMDIMYPIKVGASRPKIDSSGVPANLDAGVVLRHVDADKDGKISKEESKFVPMINAYFDYIDTNKDGFISEDELRKALSTL